MSEITDAIAQYFPNGTPPAMEEVAQLYGAQEAAIAGPQLGYFYGTETLLIPKYATQFIQNIANNAGGGGISDYFSQAQDLLSNKYAVLASTRQDTSSIANTIKDFANGASSYAGIDPNSVLSSMQSQITNTMNQYQSNQSSGFAGFMNQVGSVLSNPGTMLSLLAAPFTGGASLAIGEGILGAGAVGAATLGSAILGAGTNALMSLASGQPINPTSLITSALTAGAGVNASSLVGSLGLTDTVSNIANETGLSIPQVNKLVTNAITTGITSAATNGGDPTKAILSNLASSAVGNYAGNIVSNLDPGQLNTAASVASSVAKVGTSAALNGTNLTTALTSALPSMIGTVVGNSPTAPTNAETPTGNLPTASNNNINNALITAMQNPVDTSRNTTYEPIASNDGTPLVPSGSVTMGSPSDNPTTSPISSNLTPKEQYDRLMQTPGVDSATASEISGYDPSTDSTDVGNIVVDANTPPPNTPSDVVVTPTSNLPSTPNNTNATTGNLPVAPVAPNNIAVETPIGNLIPDSATTGNLPVAPPPVAPNNVPVEEPIDVGTITIDAQNPPVAPNNIPVEEPIDVGTITIDAQNPPVAPNNIPVEEPIDAQNPTTIPPLKLVTTTPKPPVVISSKPSTTSSTTPSTSSNTSSGALSSASTQVPAVSAPTQIVGTELAGAPVYSQNSQILAKLLQLYPQLSQVNPKLLTQLGFPTSESQIAQVPQNQSLSQTSLDENYNMPSFKTGGVAHTPEFITGHTGHYASGKGDGQSDDIKALLNDGDYVMDADAVAQLGNGSSKGGKEVLEHFRKSIPQTHHASGGKVPAMIADGEYVLPASFVAALGKGDSDAGAKMLDKMRHALREHKRSAPLNKIPPKSKSPLEYMREGLKMKAKG